MTTAIILSLCLIFLVAYVFDISSQKTRIPSAILLLGFGMGLRALADYFLEFKLPDFGPVLPVLGTIGLTLIVLEGTLELDLIATKIPIIVKSFLGSAFAVLVQSLLLAVLFSFYTEQSFFTCMANAIPLSVISSAIAIPSVRNLTEETREFVVYESSLSDIMGVLFFNFFAMNEAITASSVFGFTLEVVLMLVISVLATVVLAFLIQRIQHHVKFTPILLMILLVYALAKVWHLPSLLFIMVLGLMLGNTEKIKPYLTVKFIDYESLANEIHKFKEIVAEGTFLIRVAFFIMFGYMINLLDVIQYHTLGWAVVILISIFLVRWLQLYLSKLPIIPLIFVSPRGLITILLFLSIVPEKSIPFISQALVIQVVILASLVMMVGLILFPEKIQKIR